jgi:hypothetical protein
VLLLYLICFINWTTFISVVTYFCLYGVLEVKLNDMIAGSVSHLFLSTSDFTVMSHDLAILILL